MKLFIPILILFFGSTICMYSQDNEMKFKDNLSLRTFDYLYSKIGEHENEDSLRNVYIEAYLKKAKSENNSKRIIKGYYLKGVYFPYPESLMYFDSAITASKIAKNHTYFPYIFLEYGNVYYVNSQYHKAFNYYLEAKKISDSIGELEMSYKSNTNIAYIKRIIGDDYGAMKIYLQNKKIIDNIFEGQILFQEQLSNYHSLAYAHLRLNNNDSSTFYSQHGYKLAKKKSEQRFAAVFSLVEGINHYKQGELNTAKDSITIAYKGLEKENDTLNMAFCNLYLGKTFLRKKDTANALVNFEKGESLIYSKRKLIPELSGIYKSIWEIYKMKNNTDKELEYLTKYINYETALEGEYKGLYLAMNKKYDVPLLKKERAKVVAEFQEQINFKEKMIGLGIVLLIILTGLGIAQYLKSKSYQKKFNEIIAEKTDLKKPASSYTANVSDKITNDILTKINHFENSHGYLDPNLSLTNLAVKLNTNSSYLSKIINSNMNMSFSKYLAKLRIDYILEELVNNHKIRKYTIKAIATEAGFKNAESFSKAFKEKTGMYPSLFVKKLQKMSLNS